MRLAYFVPFVCLLAMSFGCQSDKKYGPSRGEGNQGFIGASKWKAWINAQPPGPRRLIVTGDVDVASTNATPKLEFAGLDKSNPPGLTLRLSVERSGIGGPGVTRKPARYESIEHTSVREIRIQYPNGKGETIRDIPVVE